MINVALPKGRLGEKVYAMFAEAGYECPALLEPSRKLIFENPEAGVRYFWVKPSDVAIYVERGAADIGVAGKDILLEYEPDVFELLDLDLGKCRMAVAAKKDFYDDGQRTLRVATKFTNIAARYYASKCREIDIIKLNGSIEIAPILGLSDVIVDIVETGTTLKENDLEVVETILPISARLIANKSGYKFKNAEILSIREGLENEVRAHK
jgi:ATP phosphoribosyltransferase